ncbi:MULTISPECIES: NAD(P)H-binding protein [unclassified Streptomyces]|uniref:SDR family oxidoreductase n=1 Tax=unclassified Streptomyces TaxID=2593676 RepID=UPI002DDC7287|nr:MULTISPECIES: NAD(P)H-binding protein [unclassified Streptomyces]WSA93796.1 NAD(P)H-binding protein [Streptomyces sp. NBC_01795]WSS13582.1 NAD(P)H-binding protein [Streptomyces sp. NBC_01186]WSS42377.1 NAD(P)H-binding protein [Streptomyces sp. NBC_01187]
MPRPTDDTDPHSPAPSPSPQGPVLVTGGTGTLGRPLVDALLADGVPVRVMSRRPRAQGDKRPYEWAVCDLKNGIGLAAAVAGVRAIVHCATDPFREAAVLSRLVEAARQAGGPHLVYISIVGVDTIPFSYYRGKREAERVLEQSGLPWTVLRATQFHNLIATITNAQRRLPFVFAPSGVRFQPIEVSEVAARLAELVRGAPAGRVPDLAGPAVHTARDLAEATLTAYGRRHRVVGFRLPGGMGRALRQGANLAPDRAVGTVTFHDFLAARTAAAGPAAKPREG